LQQNGTGGIWESVTNEESSGENRNHEIFEPMGENREQRSAKIIQPIRYTTPKQPSAEETQQGIQQSEVRRRRQSAQMNSGQGQPLEFTTEQPTTQASQPEQQQSGVRRRRQSAQMNLGQGQLLESTTEQPTTQTAQPVQQQSEETRRQRSAQMNLDKGQPLESTSEQTTPEARLPEQQQSEEARRPRSAQMGQGQPLESTSGQTTPEARQPEQQKPEETDSQLLTTELITQLNWASKLNSQKMRWYIKSFWQRESMTYLLNTFEVLSLQFVAFTKLPLIACIIIPKLPIYTYFHELLWWLNSAINNSGQSVKHNKNTAQVANSIANAIWKFFHYRTAICTAWLHRLYDAWIFLSHRILAFKIVWYFWFSTVGNWRSRINFFHLHNDMKLLFDTKTIYCASINIIKRKT
jgi:hypothetical protein